MKCNCTCNCPDGNHGPFQYSGKSKAASDCPGGWSMNLTIKNSTNQTMYLRSGQLGTFVISAGHTNNYTQFPNHTTFEIDWGGDGKGHGILGRTGEIAFSNGGGVAIAPGGPGDAITASGTWSSGTHPSPINFSTTGTNEWQSPSDPEHNSCQYTVNITFSGKFPPPPKGYSSTGKVTNNTSYSVSVNNTIAGASQLTKGQTSQPWTNTNKVGLSTTLSAKTSTNPSVFSGVVASSANGGLTLQMPTPPTEKITLSISAVSANSGKTYTGSVTTASATPTIIVPASDWNIGGTYTVMVADDAGLIKGTGTPSFC